MIPILHHNIDDLAQKHAEIVYNYIKNQTTPKNRFENIENWLQKHLKTDLLSILKAKPDVLRGFVDYFDKKTDTKDVLYLKKMYNTNFSSTNSNLEKDGIKYNGWAFVASLDIQICPYCNLNYIYNLKDGKRTSELDHFHDKSTYPFLAMSFYNLVPSCKVCNQLKKTGSLLINPYDSAKHETDISTFRFNIEKADYYSQNGFTFKLDFADEKDTANGVLHLDDRYQNHKNIVLEHLKRKHVYTDSYIDDLFEKNKGLFESKAELMQLVFGYHNEDLHKRPLAKLTRDIATELGLL